ncbi:MAG: hypothetical protein MJ050_09300 [Phascolarctobacterium sp.]|nr:hypothetical protein [Phascolarctobacterium sp.]
MKKLLGLLTLTAALSLGSLLPAEALEHYDNNETMSNIVFSDSLLFDKGLVGSYLANADGSRQVYFGKWNRQKNGLLNLIFQEKHTYNTLNELTSKTLISQNVVLRKQGRQLTVVKQDGGDVVKGNVYHNGEYAWGNDAYMSKYMLQQYLNNQGLATEVKEIPALTRLLDEECRALVERNLQNATGAGMWYEAHNGQIYYVESDPKAIYVLKGRSLENLAQGEEMVRNQFGCDL